MKKARRHASPPAKIETAQARRNWPTLLVAVLIAVAAVAAHAPAYSAKALCFDDNQYLLDNVLVKKPSAEAAGRFLTEVLHPSTVRGYYQPLSMIALMVEYQLGGRAADPRVFHAVSLGLHAACSVLLVLFLFMLFDSAMAAGLAGLLFAVHPMMVDALAWISERKTTLAALFALASLFCYARHARRAAGTSLALVAPSRKQEPGGRTSVFSPALAGSWVLYVLAVMAKPTAVMLPAAMVLLDIWPHRRWGRQARAEKVPFVLVALVSSYVTFFSQKNTANLFTPDENTGVKVLTFFHNVVFYPMKLLWPAHLTAHYPYPDPMSLTHPAVLVGVLGSLALAVLLVFSWRRMPALTIGFGIFLALIAPTMGLVGFNNVPACNKFIYLPVVGLLIPLTKLAMWLWQRQGHRRLVRAAVVAVPLLLASGELVATRHYLSAWQDTETLYRHMLSLAPNATFVREDLARWLSDTGKLDESIGLFRAAMQEREPNHSSQARLNMNLALTLSRRDRDGDLEEAVVHAHRAVALNQNNARWHLGLGTLLRQQKRIQEAIAEFTAAIRLDGEAYEAQCNLGLALIDEKQWRQAIAACERAIALYPEYTLAYLGLGVAKVGTGETDAAIGVLGHAADLAHRSGQRDLENLAHRQLAALTTPGRPATQ